MSEFERTKISNVKKKNKPQDKIHTKEASILKLNKIVRFERMDVCIYIHQPLRTGRIWHKVNF